MIIKVLGDSERSQSWMKEGAEWPILLRYLTETPRDERQGNVIKGWEGTEPGGTEFHTERRRRYGLQQGTGMSGTLGHREWCPEEIFNT